MESHLELTIPDRARIEALTRELERYNAGLDEDIIVTCTEAARLLGKTKATISAWIKCGKIHKTARGRSVGILLSEVRKIQNPA